MRSWHCGLIVLFLSGCGAVGSDNVGGTLQAGTQIYATEAAVLSQTDVARQTEVVGTIQVLQSQAVGIQNVNQQLYATLAAGNTPTPALEIIQAPPDSSGSDIMGDLMSVGQRFFWKTGVSTAVSSETGCVLQPNTVFSQSAIDQLYATVRVVNIQQGTPMRAEWYREGELITADDWTVPWNAEETCLWFVIDRTDTDFTPGTWSVILYADGFQLENAMTFLISQ